MRFCDLCPGDLWFDGFWNRAFMVVSVTREEIVLMLLWYTLAQPQGTGSVNTFQFIRGNTCMDLIHAPVNGGSAVWRNGMQLLK
jgi:hypothetical protein